MAILGQIQRRSGFLIGIIALALFAFIIQGLIKNSSSIGRGSNRIIAEVGDRKIETTDFRQKVALVQKQNKRISNMQAMKSVWNQVIKEAVLNNQFDKLGITVGKDRVNELISNNPSLQKAFKNEQGIFDEQALLQYIDDIYKNKKSRPELYAQWKNFENSVIENEKENIYMNLVNAAMTPTLKEGEWQYHYDNDAVDFKYVPVSYSSIPDSLVKVSKQEIANYVAKHPKKYKVEESRDIKFVFIPIKPSAQDKKDVQDKLAKLLDDKRELIDGKDSLVKGFKNTDNADAFVQKYSDVKRPARYTFKDKLIKDYADKLINLNKGDVFGPYEFNNQVYLSKVEDIKMVPDSAKASHILIAYKGAMRANPAINRSKEAAKKKADSILNLVKRNPKKFADFAKKLSDGPTKTKGGDLGWFTYGQMVPKFNDFVFNGTKGKVGLVETPFGYHVIIINDLTAPEKAIKLANIVRNVEASPETENDIYRVAAKFVNEAAQAKDFDTLAAGKGYKVQKALKLGRFEDNIPGLGSNRDIVRWAYNKDRKVGDVQKFDIETGHVIAKLTNVRQEGLMTPEEASPTVKLLLVKQKKAAKIKEKMKGSTIEEISKNANAKVGVATGVTLKNPVIPAFGKEPKVVATAFATQPDHLSKPIEGNRAVYVVQTIKVTVAPDVKNYLPFVEQLKKQKDAGINNKVVEALKEKADITDKRDLIYQ